MKKTSFLFLLFASYIAVAQQVTTLAGNGPGYNDGPIATSYFKNPADICAGTSGVFYIADGSNNCIRKIDTNLDWVSTVAGVSAEGFQDGPAATAKFSSPYGICIDSQGNLFVVDWGNFKIRKISPAGIVSTFAGSTQGYTDGVGTTAQFNYMGDICIDAQDNLYLADEGNNRIRKITPTGIVSTLAGSTEGYANGLGASAKFYWPRGICIEPSTNNLFVVETGGAKVRKITPDGTVSFIAGGIVPGNTSGYLDGVGTAAKFNFPVAISIDTLGNLYVSDSANHRIRKVTQTGIVTTYAGSTAGYTDGWGTIAQFAAPYGSCIVNNIIYLTEGSGNCKIRIIDTPLKNENFVNNKMVLYPNPNEGTFYIDLEENILCVVIYNMDGKEVYNKCNIESKTIETKLVKGMYLVKLTNDNNQTKSIKMIVNQN